MTMRTLMLVLYCRWQLAGSCAKCRGRGLQKESPNAYHRRVSDITSRRCVLEGMGRQG